MEMMILKHDKRYNRSKDISKKIEEESEELIDALGFGNNEQVVDEALDLITVCLNAIYTVGHSVDLNEAVKEHQEKLKMRGWEAEKIVRFEVE